MAIITLLTDFGTEDPYVGIMKGVILGIHPEAVVVDISHAIGPQNVLQAALSLEFAWRYFPDGTIHTVVVDPGVGSRRAIVALQLGAVTFLAPDNGVLTPILESDVGATAHRVENPDLFLKPVSRTFHGRDIFAPVAARLGAGLSLAKLGPAVPLDSLQRISIPPVVSDSAGDLVGQVIAVDHFGNLITNLRGAQLRDQFPDHAGKTLKFTIASNKIYGLASTYADAKPGELLVLEGSRGYLEISVCCGNAHRDLGVGIGEAVRIRA